MNNFVLCDYQVTSLHRHYGKHEDSVRETCQMTIVGNYDRQNGHHFFLSVLSSDCVSIVLCTITGAVIL